METQTLPQDRFAAWQARKAEFYERLANRDYWRTPCGNCSCPRWAHARAGSAGITLVGCGCGRCGNFNERSLDALIAFESEHKIGE